MPENFLCIGIAIIRKDWYTKSPEISLRASIFLILIN